MEQCAMTLPGAKLGNLANLADKCVMKIHQPWRTDLAECSIRKPLMPPGKWRHHGGKKWA